MIEEITKQIKHRRAIEALRAGVPNRDVVELLPPNQNDVYQYYIALLKNLRESWENPKIQPRGMILAADFGAGKSHWLEYFRHLALKERFVCSKITLNKETPLHNIWKIFQACVLAAELPEHTGNALYEILPSYDRDKAPYYHEFSSWVERNKEEIPRLAATLYILDKGPDTEFLDKIIGEWSGFPMKISDLKAALRELGELKNYPISGFDKSKIFLYFEFLSRFFRSRGYSGWILLIDETEMISRYSIRQRGRAYAYLAILMGHVKDTPIPGIASVFTTTPDYAGTMIHGDYYIDEHEVPIKMEWTNDAPLIPAAKKGMNLLEKELFTLNPPSSEELERTYEKIRHLYGTAYNFDPPELQHRPQISATTKMRHYIRSWVTSWDLLRLYNTKADISIQDLKIDLGEDKYFQEEESPEEEQPFL